MKSATTIKPTNDNGRDANRLITLKMAVNKRFKRDGCGFAVISDEILAIV